jgi:Zn-dependent oligopeptidase
VGPGILTVRSLGEPKHHPTLTHPTYTSQDGSASDSDDSSDSSKSNKSHRPPAVSKTAAAKKAKEQAKAKAAAQKEKMAKLHNNVKATNKKLSELKDAFRRWRHTHKDSELTRRHSNISSSKTSPKTKIILLDGVLKYFANKVLGKAMSELVVDTVTTMKKDVKKAKEIEGTYPEMCSDFKLDWESQDYNFNNIPIQPPYAS